MMMMWRHFIEEDHAIKVCAARGTRLDSKNACEILHVGVNNVGAAMGYMSDESKLPKESATTADLILFFDKLFDSVNGRFSKPVRGRLFRCVVTPQSPLTNCSERVCLC